VVWPVAHPVTQMAAWFIHAYRNIRLVSLYVCRRAGGGHTEDLMRSRDGFPRSSLVELERLLRRHREHGGGEAECTQKTEHFLDLRVRRRRLI
jgi:hypothetical protein